MDTNRAKQIAIDLMTDHGLIDRGWTFSFDSAKRRFGVCKYRPKLIQLSFSLVAANPEEQVRDTILHELAHALVGHGHGHDSVWKAKCREIGARPERCYNSDTVTRIAGRYQSTCDGCGRVHHRYKAIPRGAAYRCKCRAGKNLEWTKVN